MQTVLGTSPAIPLAGDFLSCCKLDYEALPYGYMTAAANKFLRIYYGTVTAYLEKL